ncbi:MAG: hypothetical protein HYR96_11205 [Deltaproteobacteria bacterium]|nr:hypothetical protein [Deltaproteobacteria bacterium]MBI3295968.1 hypothetical protein [Deltaproteobacteria bacterium]
MKNVILGVGFLAAMAIQAESGLTQMQCEGLGCKVMTYDCQFIYTIYTEQGPVVQETQTGVFQIVPNGQTHLTLRIQDGDETLIGGLMIETDRTVSLEVGTRGCRVFS